ncbi:hypothetical protein [Spartinivicinus ruber]|uniref:hypothetical protein n=1 Tax=Spartinivicinus ruber TaxID=2683272 RepID=UPI0013D2488F|nr:hypothetical protein [Spartinivicinus ruber]
MRKTVLAIAIVSTFTSPVFAEKSGYYLGFSAGQADYDDAYDKHGNFGLFASLRGSSDLCTMTTSPQNR